MSELSNLPPHDRMTPLECLSMCSRTHKDYRDVLVIGFGHEGELIVRSSAMPVQNALWLLMAGVDYVRDGSKHETG